MLVVRMRGPSGGQGAGGQADMQADMQTGGRAGGGRAGRSRSAHFSGGEDNQPLHYRCHSHAEVMAKFMRGNSTGTSCSRALGWPLGTWGSARGGATGKGCVRVCKGGGGRCGAVHCVPCACVGKQPSTCSSWRGNSQLHKEAHHLCPNPSLLHLPLPTSALLRPLSPPAPPRPAPTCVFSHT